MAGGKPRDHRVELMVNLFDAILTSVPTEMDRERNGAPLAQDEIPEAAAFMDQLAAQIAADRENPDGRR